MNDADVERLFIESIQTFGRSPDVVMANAGIVTPEARVGEWGPDDWWNDVVSSSLVLEAYIVVLGAQCRHPCICIERLLLTED